MTTFPALKEVEGKIADREKKLSAVFAEAGSDLDLTKVTSVDSGIKGNSLEIGAYIRNTNDELTDLRKERVQLVGVQEIAAAYKDRGERGEPTPEIEGVGEYTNDGAAKMEFGKAFVKSKAYLSKKNSNGSTRSGNGETASLDNVDVKTLFQTSAGWAPQTTRTGRVVPFATIPIEFLESLPSATTDQVAVVYMEETSYTNAAAETAEAGAYAEATLALTQRSSPVRKITVYLTVTDEQLEDVEYAEQYVNQRLQFMLKQRLEKQILTGDATGSNLQGLNTWGSIQTQAKGADTGPEAIFKAMTLVMTTGASLPSHIIMNPLDWQNIRLLKDSTGNYIWGPPSAQGVETLWGLGVTKSQQQTAGQALVGDLTNHYQIVTKRGIEVQITNSHDVYFINGKQAIRADFRVASVLFRPVALCKVTGL